MSPSTPAPGSNCTYLGESFDPTTYGPSYTVGCKVRVSCEKPNVGGIISTVTCDGTKTCKDATKKFYDAFLCYPDAPCFGPPEYVRVPTKTETVPECQPCNAPCGCPPGYREVGRSES